jgi:Glycosyl transferase family 21
VQARERLALAGLILGLYLLLTTPLWLLPQSHGLALTLSFIVLHQLFTLGVVIELTELALALVLEDRQHPRSDPMDCSSTSVAALYLCRDDIDLVAVQNLATLRDVDVFALDDSETEASRKQLDDSGLRIIRRPNRHHFKAGNLNHWLNTYGTSYKYFVVLDSDSLLSSEALWRLVSYAEHPSNSDVAIVQAAIHARPGNRFQGAIACQSFVRQIVLSRVHSRIGWTLSQGHNNLHRVDALLGIGGFGVAASCEDTLTSLELYRRGWRIIQTSTPSFEAEPASIFAYRHRLTRWARQTSDLVRCVEGAFSASSILLMFRHALSYALPSVSTGLVIVLLWLSRASAQPLFGATIEAPSHVAWRLQLLTAAGLWGALGATHLLRFVLYRRHGGSTRNFLAGALICGASAGFCHGPVEVGLIRSLLGQSTRFRSTGSLPRQSCGLRQLTCAMLGPLAFYLATLCLMIGLTSPAILWFVHRDQFCIEPR